MDKNSFDIVFFIWFVSFIISCLFFNIEDINFLSVFD